MNLRFCFLGLLRGKMFSAHQQYSRAFLLTQSSQCSPDTWPLPSLAIIQTLSRPRIQSMAMCGPVSHFLLFYLEGAELASCYSILYPTTCPISQLFTIGSFTSTLIQTFLCFPFCSCRNTCPVDSDRYLKSKKSFPPLNHALLRALRSF